MNNSFCGPSNMKTTNIYQSET